MPEKKKLIDKSYFWVAFWVIVVIATILISSVVINKNEEQKKQAEQDKANGIVDGKFEVSEDYAKTVCAKKEYFPNIDWSQNDMFSEKSFFGGNLNKDAYRLKADETVPVAHYSWSSYSSVYGKNRSMNCYFVTDMQSHQSKILWLYYRDLEGGTGNIDAIGSEQDVRDVVK